MCGARGGYRRARGGGREGRGGERNSEIKKKSKKIRPVRDSPPYAPEQYAYRREEDEEAAARTSDLSGMRAPKRGGGRGAAV